MAKVLVIDDDPAFRESTTEVLETRGYTVTSASNGTQGYEMARADTPDLMLLDVMMTHDTEGFETVRRLKDDVLTRNIPVILITGIRKAKTLPFRFEPDEDWLPVKAVLEKPVPPQELLRKVEAALSRKDNQA